MWGNSSSDLRVKNIHREYEAGLDALCRLRPVVYSYRDNETIMMDHPEKRCLVEVRPPPRAGELIGLVAQECEDVMPEMIGRREAILDGERVTDMRTLDASPLIYALINAVKELSARLREVEAKLQ